MGSESSEGWGYALFAATLISMGAGWLVFAVLSPLFHSESPTVDPFYAVFPAIFLALGGYVALLGHREYKRGQRARMAPPPSPGAPPEERLSTHP